MDFEPLPRYTLHIVLVLKRASIELGLPHYVFYPYSRLIDWDATCT